eukprot:gene1761-2101_t
MDTHPASVPLEPVPLPKELVKDGLRLDGRGFEEFRNVFLDTKVVSRAAGSAYLELGNTKVMAAVYGPRPGERKFGFSDRGRVHCEICYTSVAQKARGKQAQRINCKEQSAMLQTSLEAVVDVDKFPKAVVDVFVMVLQAGGSELAASICVASAALADAAIDLLDLLPACTVGVAPLLSQHLAPTKPTKAIKYLILGSFPSLMNKEIQMHKRPAPRFAGGALPSKICPVQMQSGNTGNDSIPCLTASATGAESVARMMSLKVAASCNGKSHFSLEYSGEPCGPDNQFVQWNAAVTSDGCRLSRIAGNDPRSIRANLNLFGACGQPPANAVQPGPSMLCPLQGNINSTLSTSGNNPTIPPALNGTENSTQLNTTTNSTVGNTTGNSSHLTGPSPSPPPASTVDPSEDGIPGPRLPRVPVVAEQLVPSGVARILAANSLGVVNTAGLPADQQLTVAVVDSFVQPNPAHLDDVSDASKDHYGHGTHVAGIVSANNNGVGVVGVSPGTPIYSIKVLDGNGKGTLSSLLKAITHALSVADTLRIRVINLSMVVPINLDSEDYQETLQMVCGVMQQASDAGIVVVAAAGNFGRDMSAYLPAACPTVVAVTAIDGARGASFSNYVSAESMGLLASTLAAPGTAILSTTSFDRDPSGYKLLTGTSMAAPHVAGVFANCFMSGACTGNLKGIDHLAVVKADAQAKLAQTPSYGFEGDATPTADGRLYGYLVWSKY